MEIRSEKLAVSKRTNCVTLVNESALKCTTKNFPTVSDLSDCSSLQIPEPQLDTQTAPKMSDERWESRGASVLRRKGLGKHGERDAAEVLFFGT